MTEFSCLKPKMYSFEFIENNSIKNDKKHKGIKNLLVFITTIIKNVFMMKEFYNLQLNKQNVYLDKINKIALNPFESKRYWIDNINSLPFGYEE